jgi:hypothetical protein
VPGALIGRVDAIPEERFWTTGDAHSAGRIMSQLWGHSVAVEAL